MNPNKKEGKMPVNIGASVRARLLNIAKGSGQDYNRVLIRYAQERLLYRISVSPYRNNFILKGALLFITYKMPNLRPTKDIDFLFRGTQEDKEGIKTIVGEVVAVTIEDGITFDPKTIAVESIAEEAAYGGLRVSVQCSVGGARNVLQVDIGFGDRIVAGPIDIEYPVLLDLPAPRIKAYSLDSAIAEKLEAIVRFNVVTSRMKDFYDVIYFAKHHRFRADTLAQAIALTFKTRGTTIVDRSVIFGDAYRGDSGRQTQWSAFHATNHLIGVGSFSDAIDFMQQFLEPILVDPKRYTLWDPETFRWQLR